MNKLIQDAKCFLIAREKEWDEKKRKRREENGKEKEENKEEKEKERKRAANQEPLYLLYVSSLETLKSIKGDSSSLPRELDII